MFKNKYITLIILMFLPMLVISTLLNLSYSLNVDEYIKINWLFVILLAIILDAFMVWLQTRKDKKKKAE
jgi:hypothetical protein